MSESARADVESANQWPTAIAERLHTRRNRESAFKLFRVRQALTTALVLLRTCFINVPHSHAETCQEEKLRVEAADPGTTFVCEERPSGGGIDPGSVSNDPATSTETPHRSTGGGGRPSTRKGVSFLHVPESEFVFSDINGVARRTKCIKVVYTPLDPIQTPIEVNFSIEVPKKLESGRIISPGEAQNVSAEATNYIAGVILLAVNSNNLSPMKIRITFLEYLEQRLKEQKAGYTVPRC